MTIKEMTTEINAAPAEILNAIREDVLATWHARRENGTITFKSAARKIHVVCMWEEVRRLSAQWDAARAAARDCMNAAMNDGKTDFVVSYVSAGIGQAIIVRAYDAGTARAYFVENDAAARVVGVSPDYEHLARRGCPVMVVPDNWAAGTVVADATETPAPAATETETPAPAATETETPAALPPVEEWAIKPVGYARAATETPAPVATETPAPVDTLDNAARIARECAAYETRRAARRQDAAAPVKGDNARAAAAGNKVRAALARADRDRRDAAARVERDARAHEGARLKALAAARAAKKDAAAATLTDRGDAAAAAVINDIYNHARALAAADSVRLTPAARVRLFVHKVDHAAARARAVAEDKGGKRPRRRFVVVTPRDAAADTTADATGKVRAVVDITDTARTMIDNAAGHIAYQSLRTCDANQRETRRGAADIVTDANGETIDAPTYADHYSSIPYTSRVMEQAPAYTAYETRRSAAALDAAPVCKVVNHGYSMGDMVTIVRGDCTTTAAGRKPYYYAAAMDAAAAYTMPAARGNSVTGWSVNMYPYQLSETPLFRYPWGQCKDALYTSPARTVHMTDWRAPVTHKIRRARVRLANSEWTEIVGTKEGNARAASVMDTLPDYADVKQEALTAFYQLIHDGALSDISNIWAFNRLVYARVNAYINAQCKEGNAAPYDVAPDYFTRAAAAAGNKVDANGADYDAADALDNVETIAALKSAVDAAAVAFNGDAARVLYYLARGHKVRDIASMEDISYGKSWVHKTVKKLRAWLIKNPEIFEGIFGISPAAIRY